MAMGSDKNLSCPQRKMRLMSVLVDGTGTASLGGICYKNMTLTDNGVGDYTLTYDLPFQQAPQILVTPVTANIAAKVTASLVGSCTIKTVNLSNAATDADFHVVIVGSDTADQI